MLLAGALGLGLGLGGFMTANNTPLVTAQAAQKSRVKTYKQTMPNALRGTWRAKGYQLKFTKNSYTYMKLNKHNRVTKSAKFTMKQVWYVEYAYKTKHYYILPRGTKQTRAYAGYLELNPAKHHGKKVLVAQPMTGKKVTYLYKVK